MLWVFAIALTPWSAFHHHQTVNEPVEKHCTHKFHVKTSQEVCLVCSAHFEKHYILSETLYTTYLNSQLLFKSNLVLPSAYTELIFTSLRGPPALS